MSVTAEHEGAIVRVTIDGPPLQLVDGPFFGALLGLLDRIDADPAVRVVVFRSADPDFFLMHGDVETILAAPTGGPEPTEPNIAAATFERIRRSPYISIGVVDGIARGGGCEFLSALDLRIGSERTRVGQPEVALGILPGAGGTVRWARLVGRATALELILTCRDVAAEEALALGWLQRLVPTEHLETEADALARSIARMPAASIAEVKRVVDETLGGSMPALAAESAALHRLMASGTHLEPMRKFLAAGGQTRERETTDLAPLIDASTV